MPKRIAIVGLGPTGAFAAKAAHDLKCDVEIFITGDLPATTPPGAFWLHWLPQDVSGSAKPVQVYITGEGSSDNYTKRQWGKVYPSSFPTQPVWETAYNPADVLDKLVPSSCNMNFLQYPLSDTDIKDLSVAYDLVFQTFPTRESREYQPVLLPYVAAAKFGQEDPEKNYVFYNGKTIATGGPVVREAVLFGNHFLEFPKQWTEEEVRHGFDLTGYTVKILKDIDPITKPWPQPTSSKIRLLGRWATWDRKVLSHDAYSMAQKFIRELEV